MLYLTKKLELTIPELRFFSTSDLLAYADFYMNMENGVMKKDESATTPDELEAMLDG